MIPLLVIGVGTVDRLSFLFGDSMIVCTGGYSCSC